MVSFEEYGPEWWLVAEECPTSDCSQVAQTDGWARAVSVAWEPRTRRARYGHSPGVRPERLGGLAEVCRPKEETCELPLRINESMAWRALEEWEEASFETCSRTRIHWQYLDCGALQPFSSEVSRLVKLSKVRSILMDF